MNNLVIIQARLGSKRFKNKILKKINNISLIEILYNRVSKSKLYKTVVAIPDNYQNDPLALFLDQKKIPKFRGNEENVLSRYYFCARSLKADNIIRITSDCPLVDFRLIEEFLNSFHKNKVDYLSNTFKLTYPDGFDIEIFKFKILKEAYNKAEDSFDKEHVTSYFQKINNIKILQIKNNFNLANFRLTVDYQKDFTIIKKIFKYFGYNFRISSKTILNFVSKQNKLGNEIPFRNIGSYDYTHQALWNIAKNLIPGGNMLLSKNPDTILPDLWPTYFKKAKGVNIWDLDNKKYFDCFTMGVGTNILGYANNDVDKGVISAIKNGSISTLNSFEEVKLAEKLISLHPWADMVKFAKTGAEANSIAIRLARASTKKNNIAVCGYHGWHDWYLSANLQTKSNLDNHLLQGLNVSGVPKKLTGTTYTFNYNDIDSLKKLIKEKNIGIIKMEVIRNQIPKDNFLNKVRILANKFNIILIFDECTTGFRETFGGIHLKYKVNPDIAVFGKALGNGYPITAVLGINDIMKNYSKTFISSTFWSDRVGFVAGIETLKIMEKKKSWIKITNLGKYIKNKWLILSKKNKVNIKITGIPSLLNFDIISKDSEKYMTYLSYLMLKNSILASSAFYISILHNKKNLKKYFNVMDNFFNIVFKCETGKMNIDDSMQTSVRSSKFQRLN